VTDRTNVLLVVLDSVRARNTSLHGYERETTPFLSDFADRSTVYTQARSPSIHSIASHVSMFTGEHVEEHQAFRHTAQIDLTETIWHDLEAEFRYATGLFTNNRIVSNASNLGEGFEYVHEPSYPLAERLENKIDGTILKQVYFHWYNSIARLSEYVGSDDSTEQPDTAGTADGDDTDDSGLFSGPVSAVTGALSGSEDDDESGYKTLFGGQFVDAFLEWQAAQTEPWAACLNLMDAHSPYEPDAEYDRWATDDAWHIQDDRKPSVWETLTGTGWDRIEALEDLYDGTIRQTDAILETLVSELEARDLLSETLLVITSDHGEGFGEQSRLNDAVRLRGHKWGVHEAITHVPLVVSYPNQHEGRVVDDVVSLTRLPSMMRTAATGESGHEALTADDVVLTSTFRLPEAKRSKYSAVEGLENYIGPWRAVYETDNGAVRKFAQKGDHHLTATIDGAADVTVDSRDPHGRVAEEYDRLTDSDLVTQASSDIDDDLEQQLEDLGYIR
jgi:arylsulfatase A-like enzyme